MPTESAGTASKSECQKPPTLAESSADGTQDTEEFEAATLLGVNDCFSLPCQNDALCNVLEFGYACSCLPGYSGMQCQIDIDECESAPCFNSGTCIDQVNNFTCICPPGFTGHDCHTNINECSSNPCQNGGSCLDKVLGYTCICPDGITGINCELEAMKHLVFGAIFLRGLDELLLFQVDECGSNPCQNGAICVDLVSNYTCRCRPGWMGKLCEEPVDECLSDPCRNGATCNDLVGSFSCQCPPGFDGHLCQNDIDECAPQPCASGATCIDLLAAFKCLCPPGRVGRTCNSSVEPDFVLNFSSSGRLDYVAWEEGFRQRQLRQFTLCLWMQTFDQVPFNPLILILSNHVLT